MNPDRWESAKRLFHEALERPPADRDRFVREAAGSDDALREEVVGLVAAQTRAGQLFSGIARAGPPSVLPPGTRLGPYEIQRLIGRALRGVTDMRALGERQIVLDCDVLQADGGTRTASICGAYVALHDACTRLVQAGLIPRNPLTAACAAISVGIVGGVPMLDLDYSEDSTADVDMNVVMTSEGRFAEVQGTAEGMTFARGQLESMLGLAEAGI